MDEAAGAKILEAYEGTDALLLDRRTYDVFAAYWPHQDGGEDNEIARLFNSIPKHVASRGGVGKKVFDGGAVPRNVTLLEPPFAGPKGSVFLRDGLAEGTPGTGDMITR